MAAEAEYILAAYTAADSAEVSHNSVYSSGNWSVWEEAIQVGAWQDYSHLVIVVCGRDMCLVCAVVAVAVVGRRLHSVVRRRMDVQTRDVLIVVVESSTLGIGLLCWLVGIESWGKWWCIVTARVMAVYCLQLLKDP